ncbi:MAG: pitrilysin family protein [Bacteroidota bacterium]
MINRQQAPDTPAFLPLQLPNVTKLRLCGKTPLTILHNANHPLLSIHITFYAGNWYATQAGIAYLTAKMLTKGTTSQSADMIAQAIEHYGGRISISHGNDLLYVTLSALDQYITRLFPLLIALLTESNFPVAAFDKLSKLIHEKINQHQANPQTYASQKIREAVFGDNHPYGAILDHEKLKKISAADLQTFFNDKCWQQAEVFLNGNVTPSIIAALDKAFSAVTPKPLTPTYHQLQPKKRQIKLTRANSVQSVIHMGHPTITPTHPDYISLYITNQLLGGFFGSRLMRNIREDKGYTYGIHSYIDTMQHHSFWGLYTAVHEDHTQATYAEIAKEINQLKEKPITQEELNILKSYLTGELLGGFEDFSASVSRLENLYMHHLDLHYYHRLYETIQHITPIEIQQIAQKYLGPADLHQVTIGR